MSLKKCELKILFFLFLSVRAVFGDTINICFVSNEKYMKPTTVALASILKNSARDDAFHFYIIDMGISKLSKAKMLSLKRIKNFEIDFFNISDGRIKLIPIDRRKKSQRLGVAAYARIFLCDLLPHLDKILYLDGDIMVRKSLRELWSTDIKNYYLGAVIDFIGYETSQDYLDFLMSYKNQKSPYYFNSGVLLMNLKKFRQDKIPEKILNRIFELFKIGRLGAHDQDALNNLLGFKTKILHPKFNYVVGCDLECFENFSIDERLKESRENHSENVIIHFAGEDVKPWDPFNVILDAQMQEEYFEALDLTPYCSFTDKIHKFWALYIWNKIIRLALRIR